MAFLRFLESIRLPFFDAFFSLITYLGDELVFMTVAIFVFWCVSKREGYFILLGGFAGTLVNQTLKLAFRISRPWVLDPDFTIVESARAAATGYSFPSGHTQNIVATTGALFLSHKRRALRVCLVVIAALVCFSRMYLGVHTPWDVLAALGVALPMLLLIEPIFRTEESMRRGMPWVCGGFFLLSVAFLLYVLLQPEGVHEAENLASALKNACTLLACGVGLPIIRLIDAKWVKFETRAPWYVQVLKLLLGLAGALGIKAGLAAPLNLLFGNEYVARTVRYLLLVLFVGAGWPALFRFFAKIRVAPLDRFGERVAAFFARRPGKEKGDETV